MTRRLRRWLVALATFALLVGALAWYGVRSFDPPAGPAAAPLHTALGDIRGTREAGLTVYRGIPYAAAPIGERRWRPPASTSWQGTLDASHFKPACMQVGSGLPGSLPRSEDCLGLNIWTPAARPDEKRAVMVFIHGGGFTNLSSDLRFFWGDRLAQKGVIVVTLNYRLGVLGFLAHPELSAESAQHASGNYALLDCIAALRWVKDNIDAFGGDPDNVTLFGQSAGAVLASELMVSPLARGLFARVIGMSGADIGDAGTLIGIPLGAQAEAGGVEFARSIGADSLATLRELSAEALMKSAGTVADQPLINLPSVDGYVLPQQVDAALGTARAIDLMVGVDAQDGVSSGGPRNAEAYAAQIRERYGTLADRFLEAFPGRSDEEAQASDARLASVFAAWRAFTWARIHAQDARGRTFGYVFSRVPPWTKTAAHASDVPYLFGFPRALFYLVPWRTKRDLALADELQRYWTNFAKTGDPNSDGLPTWQPFAVTESVLNFGDSTHMELVPYRADFALVEADRQQLRRRAGLAAATE